MSSKKRPPRKPGTKRSSASLAGSTTPDGSATQPAASTSVTNVQIGSYLAEPEGLRPKPEQQSPQVRAL